MRRGVAATPLTLALPLLAFMTANPVQAQQRVIGPSFDCGSPAAQREALAQLICSDPELARLDLAYVQAFQALRHQAGEVGSRDLRREANDFQANVLARCGIPAAPGPNQPVGEKVQARPAAPPTARPCAAVLYRMQRQALVERLQPAARAEAERPLQAHIALQASLLGLGFLSSTATADGNYGPSTRSAIVAWQQTLGAEQTGFLSETDVVALHQATQSAQAMVAPPATTLQDAAPRVAAPPPTSARPASPSLDGTGLEPPRRAESNAPLPPGGQDARAGGDRAPAAAFGAPSGSVRDANGRLIQTVVAEGAGADVESAARNAAENALKQVVGSFIDSERSLERRTRIENGIKEETKEIRSAVRDYSQGSIQTFDLLDARMENGLYRASARVGVRVEDFRAYVRRAAEGQAAMGPGLYAQIATQNRQQQNAQSLLENSVFRPILTGQAVRIDVGRPMPLAEAGVLVPGMRQGDARSALAVKPIASLPRDAFDNIRNVLVNIAGRRDRTPDNGQRYTGKLEPGEYPVTLCPKRAGTERLCEVFIVPSIDSAKMTSLVDGLAGTRYGHPNPQAQGNVKVRAEIQGPDGGVLYEFETGGQRYQYASTNLLIRADQSGQANRLMQFPLLHYHYGLPGNAVIRESVQAVMVFSPSEETLRQAQRIVVSYQQ